MTEFNTIVLGSIKIIHIIFWVGLIVGVFVAKTRKMLAAIILCLVLVFYSWLVFKECPFTSVESYFGEKEVPNNDGARKSFISTYLENMGISADVVGITMNTGIVLLIALCLWKLI